MIDLFSYEVRELEALLRWQSKKQSIREIKNQNKQNENEDSYKFKVLAIPNFEHYNIG